MLILIIFHIINHIIVEIKILYEDMTDPAAGVIVGFIKDIEYRKMMNAI